MLQFRLLSLPSFFPKDSTCIMHIVTKQHFPLYKFLMAFPAKLETVSFSRKKVSTTFSFQMTFLILDQLVHHFDLDLRCTGPFAGCCFLICPSREEADKAVNAYHNKRTLPGVCERISFLCL